MTLQNGNTSNVHKVLELLCKYDHSINIYLQVIAVQVKILISFFKIEKRPQFQNSYETTKYSRWQK